MYIQNYFLLLYLEINADTSIQKRGSLTLNIYISRTRDKERWIDIQIGSRGEFRDLKNFILVQNLPFILPSLQVIYLSAALSTFIIISLLSIYLSIHLSLNQFFPLSVSVCMYVYILSIVYLDIYISLHLSNLSYLTYTNLYLHIYVSI